PPPFYLLAGSIGCLRATDSAYNYALLKGTYSHTQLGYDAGWILYYLLWGAAALHPSMRSLEEPAQDARTRLTKLRLAALGGACLIAPAIRFAQQFHNADVLVVVVASAVLFLLVVARMAGLVRQEERAVSRELALRAAGVQLVAAAGPEQVHNAAVSSVRVLLGESTRARLVLFGEQHARLAASTDGDGERRLAEAASSWLRASAGAALVAPAGELPAPVRRELALEHE